MTNVVEETMNGFRSHAWDGLLRKPLSMAERKLARFCFLHVLVTAYTLIPPSRAGNHLGKRGAEV